MLYFRHVSPQGDTAFLFQTGAETDSSDAGALQPPPPPHIRLRAFHYKGFEKWDCIEKGTALLVTGLFRKSLLVDPFKCLLKEDL